MGLGLGPFFPRFSFTLSAEFKANLLYAGIFLMLTIVVGLNLKHNPKFRYEGFSSNYGFMSVFALLLFIVVTIYFGIKAWFSIPADGYMDYFAFAGISLILALIFIANLVSDHILSYRMSHNAYLINGIPILNILNYSIFAITITSIF